MTGAPCPCHNLPISMNWIDFTRRLDIRVTMTLEGYSRTVPRDSLNGQPDKSGSGMFYV